MTVTPFPRYQSLRAAALSGALLLAGPLAAQQDTDDAAEPALPGVELEMGEPVGPDAEGDRLGEPYILEMSGDWEVRCIRTGLPADPCALHQLLQDGAGNSVATIEVVNLPEGQQAAAGATIVTPLETLLTRQITLSVDGGQGRRYPFNFCTEAGCVSRVGFTEGEVNAFRRGAQATLTIVPAGAPDQTVDLTVSLMGFTAGFARIVELNEANADAIAEARAAAGEQGQQ